MSMRLALTTMALDFPVIYLLDAHLGPDRLHELEEQIPTLTYDASEAEILLGNVSKKNRALLELRHLNIVTDEVSPAHPSQAEQAQEAAEDADPSLTSDDDGPHSTTAAGASGPVSPSARTVKVVKLAWFDDCTAQGALLPLDDYIVYEGRRRTQPAPVQPSPKTPIRAGDILARAKVDADGSSAARSRRRWRRAGLEGHQSPSAKPPALAAESTAEHDADSRLPPIPDFLHTPYSCQRPTLAHPPNEPFIQELVKIRDARRLNGDRVGIRAYSTSIAAIASYPYSFSTAAGTDKTRSREAADEPPLLTLPYDCCRQRSLGCPAAAPRSPRCSRNSETASR